MTLPPAPPTTPGGAAPAARPARRRPPWLVPLVVVLALVLVAAVALVATLVLRPGLERRANIAAVSAAFDDCSLGGTGATVDRENGSVDLRRVGSPYGPSWTDVECLTDALAMPPEHLAALQEPGGMDAEEVRWDAYMALRLEGGGQTSVFLYHDWSAPIYGD
ncbi:hypothetical protein G8C93_02595 [Cellulosimicrobium cellulans]|uniref:hypothetical protein n=1 Tax=Cellulosimicrobium cellulans TaxID=1710 RepID=UPI00188483D9|nr:hypothetical protein [Cellulosimicrobium cellulans]MBE9924779.1 hypothetical protein [Cellulosimicrobium cellulans]